MKVFDVILPLAMGLLLALALVSDVQACDSYCGLTVEPEHRCSPYDRAKDYRYPASIEWDIVERAGYNADKSGILDRPFPSPYVAGLEFYRIKGKGGTDIEHIVATSEAHDSGLCAAQRAARLGFATDLDNLTIASPRVNRYQKSDKDAAEWLPEINQHTYAAKIVEIKQKYGLSVDPAERDALQEILGDYCPGR